MWQSAAYVGGSARVLLAGYANPTDGALTIPAGGADLWVRVTDAPEVDAQRIERISVA